MKKITLTIGPLLSCPSRSHAGGLYLYEVNANEVGLARAGFAARTEDASTVFTNPAGTATRRAWVWAR